jgi:hypothetical protein
MTTCPLCGGVADGGHACSTVTDAPANLVSLASARREPDSEVVDLLREWLALAKRGEIRSVVLTGEALKGDEELVRYGRAGFDGLLRAASLMEQHVFNLRYDVQLMLEDAEPLELGDDDE